MKKYYRENPGGQFVPVQLQNIDPGDRIKIVHPNGSNEILLWPEPPTPTYMMSTLDWLRSELGETEEYNTRIAAQTDSALLAFMQMLDSRMVDGLVTSDPLYRTGVLMLETAGIIDATKTDNLLALGNHTR